MLTLRTLITKHQTFVQSILSDDYILEELLTSSVKLNEDKLSIAYLGSMMGIALICEEGPVSSINISDRKELISSSILLYKSSF